MSETTPIVAAESRPVSASSGPSLGDVFSNEKPKDALDGIASGISNATKGIFGGLAMMVAAPIQGGIAGAQNGGAVEAVKGAGLGLGMGIVAGAATAIYGVGSGIAQVGRGVVNQSTATLAQMEGCDWDEEKREWVLYNLPQDAKAVLEKDESAFIADLESQFRARYDDEVARLRAGASRTDESEAGEAAPKPEAPLKQTPQVASMELYDVLGVQSHATSVEIKKAYYVLAKASHPDKHPDDAEAGAKFARINNAYSVLSDETTRKAYDKAGEINADKNQSMDAKSLFAMLFGSEDFEPLIGELQVQSQMRLGLAAAQDMAEKRNAVKTEEAVGGEENIPPFSMEAHQGYGTEYNTRLMAFLQRQRQVRCAVNLASRLQTFLDSFSNYTAGDSEGFSALANKEASNLASTPLGAVLVSIIGVAYVEFARSEQDVFDKIAVGATQAVRNAYTKASIGYTGAKSLASSVAPNFRKSFSSISSWFSRSGGDKEIPVEAEEGKALVADDSATAASQTPESSAAARAGVEAAVDLEEEKEMRSRAVSVMNNMLIIIFRLAQLDIRFTTAQICRKVVHDHSIDELSRKRRAQALRLLGDAFVQHGKPLQSVNDICEILNSSSKAMSGNVGEEGM